MKIIKPIIALLFFLQILFTSVFAWDATPDAALEGQIRTKYSRFLSSQGEFIQKNRAICPAVHFVNDLGTQLLKADLTDLPRTNELRRMMSAILLYGTGVGGISTRQANEDETQSMVNAIFLVTYRGERSTAFTVTTDHEQAVQGLVEQSKELLEICVNSSEPYYQAESSYDFMRQISMQKIDHRLAHSLLKFIDEDEDYIRGNIWGRNLRRSLVGRAGTLGEGKSREGESLSMLRRVPLGRESARAPSPGRFPARYNPEGVSQSFGKEEKPVSKEEIANWKW